MTKALTSILNAVFFIFCSFKMVDLPNRLINDQDEMDYDELTN